MRCVNRKRARDVTGGGETELKSSRGTRFERREMCPARMAEITSSTAIDFAPGRRCAILLMCPSIGTWKVRKPRGTTNSFEGFNRVVKETGRQEEMSNRVVAWSGKWPVIPRGCRGGDRCAIDDGGAPARKLRSRSPWPGRESGVPGSDGTLFVLFFF